SPGETAPSGVSPVTPGETAGPSGVSPVTPGETSAGATGVSPAFTGAASSNMQPAAGFLAAVMGIMALL
ncbi:hypothetical protein M747DRAFT_343496, partial [Aspergillus niger ATCC 13496]